MKNSFLWMVGGAFLFLVGAGCGTGGGVHSVYVYPEIEGRVIDAKTKLPIDRVVIVRNARATKSGVTDYISAGEVQYAHHSVYTDKDGRFEVPDKQDLEQGSDKTWDSVTLKFLHVGYQMFSTNFVHGGVEGGAGEPVMLTGDIELQPLPTARE